MVIEKGRIYENVEIADLKEPAKVKWKFLEVQNLKPSLQQDAYLGGRGVLGLCLLLRIQGSRTK